MGIVHVCYIPKEIRALDMVPVDLVANALICAAKDIHDDFRATRDIELSSNRYDSINPSLRLLMSLIYTET